MDVARHVIEEDALHACAEALQVTHLVAQAPQVQGRRILDQPERTEPEPPVESGFGATLGDRAHASLLRRVPALRPAASQYGIALGCIKVVAVAGARDEAQAGDAILVAPLPAVEAFHQPQPERQLPHAATARGNNR